MKKTMLLAGITLLFATSLLFLSGCRNTMQQPPETVERGVGNIVLSVTHERMARTIQPGNVAIGDFTHFRVVLTPGSGNTPTGSGPWGTTITSATTGTIPNIPEGYWDVVVTGYVGLAAYTAGTFIARFEDNDHLDVTAAGPNVINAVLTPIFTGAGNTGTFSWAITGPGSFVSMAVAPGPFTGTGLAGSVTMPVGNHTVTLTLEYGTPARQLTITSALQIFGNMTSHWALPVTSEMFLRSIQEVVLGSRRASAWNIVADGLTYAHFAYIDIYGLTGIPNTEIQSAFTTISATAGTDALVGPYTIARLEQLVDAVLVSRAPQTLLDGPHVTQALAETEIANLITPGNGTPITNFNWAWNATDNHWNVTVTVGDYYQVPLAFEVGALPPPDATGDITVDISIAGFTFSNAPGSHTIAPVTVSFLTARTTGVPITITGGDTWSLNGASQGGVGGAELNATNVTGIGTLNITVYTADLTTGRNYSTRIELPVTP